jgi:hypothetical protein
MAKTKTTATVKPSIAGDVYNKVTDASGKSVGGVKLTKDQFDTVATNNPVLAQKYKNEAVPQSSVSGMGQDIQFINEQQDADISNANGKTEVVPTRDGSGASPVVDQYSTPYDSLIEKLTGGKTNPETPSYMTAYENMRKQYDVNTLEASVNDLSAQEEELSAQLRQGRQEAIDSVVPMSVVAGRVSEVERAQMERIDAVRRQKQTAVNQLTTANNTIENIMNFKKLDYDTAKSAYHDALTENLSIFNTVKGIMDDQKTDEERANDNARANLQIIYGNIADSGQSPASLDPAIKANIQKLEMQAGLPSGFYAKIAQTDPGGKILSTTTRSTSGAKYADIIMRNPDGSISTKQVYLGGTDEGSADGKGKDYSEPDLARANRSIISNALNSVTGQDGYIAPTDYASARAKAITSGAYDRKTFDEEFARQYVNPTQYGEVGVTYAIKEAQDPLYGL